MLVDPLHALAAPDLSGLLDQAAHNPSIHQVRAVTAYPGEVLDFCVPVNPYFPPPELLARLQAHLPDLLRHYPDTAEVHDRHMAQLLGLPTEQVVVANGSTEIITSLCQQLAGPMVTTVPTFGRWTDLPSEGGHALHLVPHLQAQGWQIDAATLVREVLHTGATTLVLCNPNNPTGVGMSLAEVSVLARSLPHLDSVVIDESFIDFSNLDSARHLVQAHPNLVVVSSLGKSLGWHGIRLGYAVAHPQRAAELRARLPWWNVNAMAAFVLQELARCPDLQQAWRHSFVRIAADREALLGRLRALPGLTVYPSQANFVLVTLPDQVSGRALRAKLLSEHGVYVRDCGNKLGGRDAWLRLAVLPPAQTDRLVRALACCLPAV